MKQSILLSAAVILGLGLGSCSKSDSDNPSSGSSQVHYELRTSNKTASINQRATLLGSMQWTSGFANPTMVKFEAEQNNSEIEFKSYNTSQIDLMAPVPVPFGNFSLPSGTYSEIELKIQLNSNGSSPALQLNGQFTNSTTSIPVTLVVNGLTEIKTEQKNVTITNGSFAAITTLDLSTFTNGITEAMILAAQQTSGTILISSSSNTSLYNIILNNFKNHSHHCEFEHD